MPPKKSVWSQFPPRFFLLLIFFPSVFLFNIQNKQWKIPRNSFWKIKNKTNEPFLYVTGLYYTCQYINGCHSNNRSVLSAVIRGRSPGLHSPAVNKGKQWKYYPLETETTACSYQQPGKGWTWGPQARTDSRPGCTVINRHGPRTHMYWAILILQVSFKNLVPLTMQFYNISVRHEQYHIL